MNRCVYPRRLLNSDTLADVLLGTDYMVLLTAAEVMTILTYRLNAHAVFLGNLSLLSFDL